MFNTSKQRLVISLVIGGLIFTIFVAFPMFVAFYNFPTFLLILLGIAILCTGIIVGLKESHMDSSKQSISVENNAYIMNVLIVDRRGEPVFDIDLHDPNEPKYLVQIELQNRKKIELETSPHLLNGIGEGMRGRITYQGKWLSKFEPAFMTQNQS